MLKNKLLDKNSSSCFKTTTENIVLPNILIFSFDLEQIGNLNDDYQIIDKNQDKILNFLEYNIMAGKKNIYWLLLLICQNSIIMVQE